MKKLNLSILFVFCFMFAKSQTSESVTKYGGELKKEVWLEFTEEEKKAYYDCVTELGLDTATIVWADKSLMDSLYYDVDYYTTKILVKHTNGKNIPGCIYPGKHSLSTPKCLLFVERTADDTKIRIQMYY